MPDFNAVLILGHFVVSVFQVPLGQPMYQFIPFPSMEICQQYAQYHQTPQTGHKMSIEYNMYKSANCITREVFEAEMAKRQAPTAPVAPTPEQNVPVVPKGWEIK